MNQEKTNIEKVTSFFNKFLTADQKLAFKAEFGEIPTLPVTPVTMTESKLKDGTVIKYDAPTLVEGVVVMVVGADMTELPAPVGDWELEDGTIVSIGDGGVVTAVKAVEVAPEVAPAEPVVQSASEPNKLVEALKTIMEGRFNEQTKLIEKLTSENVALKAEFAKQNEVINQVSAFFNAIGEVKTGEVPASSGFSKKSKAALSYIPQS